MAQPTALPHAGYVHDKVDHLLLALARQVEILKVADIDDSLREELLDEACKAVTMGTRILASATESKCYVHHSDLIIAEGRRGYRKLVDEWGVLSNVRDLDLRTDDEVLADFLKELTPLLDGPRAPNRTMIHELLVRTKRRHPAISLISELTEKVTMGELEWHVFITQVRAII